MKQLYVASYQQTIFDVALQFYGSAEGVDFLLEDNPSIIASNGAIDLSAAVKIRKSKIDPIVLDLYDGYIPVTEGVEGGYSYVLIDDNGDFLIDGNGDTLLATN
jgi:hypothetical protein